MTNGHGHHWSYKGKTGPEFWGDLSYDFALCKTGKKQSPVNIDTTKMQKEILPALDFSYDKTPLRMINNGHSIQINCAKGNFVTFGENKYELIQFHFHRTSEHTINNEYFDMELHLVHRSAKGDILIIGVFFEEGRFNSEIKEIWNHIDEEEKPEFMVHGSFINPIYLIPEDLRYFLYSGSLTMPGCDEGVTWIVLKEPIQVSFEQIEKFELIFPTSCRPIQPLNGRVIRESK